MFVRTEQEWQDRERQLLEQNSASLERARAAEARLSAINGTLLSASETMYKSSCQLGEFYRQRNESLAEITRLRIQLDGGQKHQPFEYDPRPLTIEEQAIHWVRTAIGAQSATPAERALRLLEEAMELAQAEGISRNQTAALADHVHSRPKGEAIQEARGVAFCAYAYCGAIGQWMLLLAMEELSQAQSKDAKSIDASLQRKSRAGLLTHPYDSSGE